MCWELVRLPRWHLHRPNCRQPGPVGFCGHPTHRALLSPWSYGQFLLLPGRLPETTVVYPADVVLFEGILVFYSQEIRDMFHLRLFVDTDSDVRLSRRGKADRPLCPWRGWLRPRVPMSEGHRFAPVPLQFFGT